MIEPSVNRSRQSYMRDMWEDLVDTEHNDGTKDGQWDRKLFGVVSKAQEADHPPRTIVRGCHNGVANREDLGNIL